MLRTAIRHDTTSRAIAAYLAATTSTRTTRRIVGYMQLMHATPPKCTVQALSHLTRCGAIERVRRGRYRGT